MMIRELEIEWKYRRYLTNQPDLNRDDQIPKSVLLCLIPGVGYVDLLVLEPELVVIVDPRFLQMIIDFDVFVTSPSSWEIISDESLIKKLQPFKKDLMRRRYIVTENGVRFINDCDICDIDDSQCTDYKAMKYHIQKVLTKAKCDDASLESDRLLIFNIEKEMQSLEVKRRKLNWEFKEQRLEMHRLLKWKKELFKDLSLVYNEDEIHFSLPEKKYIKTEIVENDAPSNNSRSNDSNNKNKNNNSSLHAPLRYKEEPSGIEILYNIKDENLPEYEDDNFFMNETDVKDTRTIIEVDKNGKEIIKDHCDLSETTESHNRKDYPSEENSKVNTLKESNANLNNSTLEVNIDKNHTVVQNNKNLQSNLSEKRKIVKQQSKSLNNPTEDRHVNKSTKTNPKVPHEQPTKNNESLVNNTVLPGDNSALNCDNTNNNEDTPMTVFEIIEKYRKKRLLKVMQTKDLINKALQESTKKNHSTRSAIIEKLCFAECEKGAKSITINIGEEETDVVVSSRELKASASKLTPDSLRKGPCSKLNACKLPTKNNVKPGILKKTSNPNVYVNKRKIEDESHGNAAEKVNVNKELNRSERHTDESSQNNSECNKKNSGKETSNTVGTVQEPKQNKVHFIEFSNSSDILERIKRNTTGKQQINQKINNTDSSKNNSDKIKTKTSESNIKTNNGIDSVPVAKKSTNIKLINNKDNSNQITTKNAQNISKNNETNSQIPCEQFTKSTNNENSCGDTLDKKIFEFSSSKDASENNNDNIDSKSEITLLVNKEKNNFNKYKNILREPRFTLPNINDNTPLLSSSETMNSQKNILSQNNSIFDDKKTEIINANSVLANYTVVETEDKLIFIPKYMSYNNKTDFTNIRCGTIKTEEILNDDDDNDEVRVDGTDINMTERINEKYYIENDGTISIILSDSDNEDTAETSSNNTVNDNKKRILNIKRNQKNKKLKSNFVESDDGLIVEISSKNSRNYRFNNNIDKSKMIINDSNLKINSDIKTDKFSKSNTDLNCSTDSNNLINPINQIEKTLKVDKNKTVILSPEQYGYYKQINNNVELCNNTPKIVIADQTTEKQNIKSLKCLTGNHSINVTFVTEMASNGTNCTNRSPNLIEQNNESSEQIRTQSNPEIQTSETSLNGSNLNVPSTTTTNLNSFIPLNPGKDVTKEKQLLSNMSYETEQNSLMSSNNPGTSIEKSECSASDSIVKDNSPNNLRVGIFNSGPKIYNRSTTSSSTLYNSSTNKSNPRRSIPVFTSGNSSNINPSIVTKLPKYRLITQSVFRKIPLPSATVTSESGTSSIPASSQESSTQMLKQRKLVSILK